MDESVIRAMLKWPNVPAVFGWLSLDDRGAWRLKGAPIKHPGIKAFINRNYDADQQGRFFLQNGPQRVFVALSATPWIYRFESPRQILTHTNHPVNQLKAVWLDDRDRMLFETEHGIGLLHDGDLLTAFELLVTANGEPPEDMEHFEENANQLRFQWLEGLVEVKTIEAADIPKEFGFVTHPSP